MNEGGASSEGAKIAQIDSQSNAIAEDTGLAGERGDTLEPTDKPPINEQQVEPTVEEEGVENGSTNKSHTESSNMARATSVAGESSDTIATSDAKANGNISKEESPSVESMTRKIDQSDGTSDVPSSNMESKPQVENDNGASLASAANVEESSDHKNGAKVASQSSSNNDVPTDGGAVRKDGQEDSKIGRMPMSDELEGGIFGETQISTRDLQMKTPEKEQSKDSMVISQTPNEEESKENGHTGSVDQDNQGSILEGSKETLEEDRPASSVPGQESPDNDRKPSPSGKCSPLLIVDMELMKTDEELPEFDFGRPKPEAERKGTPWATSRLPPHIDFLLSRNIIPEKEPVKEVVKEPLVQPVEETQSKAPPQTREPSLSVEGTPIPKDWSSISEREGNKSEVEAMPPPEPGMEDFVLQHRPERLQAKKVAALQAKGSSRHAKQKQSMQKKPQQPSNASVAAAQPKEPPVAALKKAPPTGAHAKTPEQAPGMPSCGQNQNSSQNSAGNHKPPPSSQGQHPTLSQHSASAHPQQAGTHAGRYFPPPPGQYTYGHSAPTAAKKPIRRLAKIRPYANQSTPFSAEEIRIAIPKDASSVFHIMDRRINLDSFEVDETSVDAKVPIYSLLRAWVQDDPYRQIPPPLIILPTTAEPHGHESCEDLVRQAKRLRDEANNRNRHKKKKPKQIVDVFGHMQRTQSSTSSQATYPKSSTKLPSLDSLKSELVKEARAKKKSQSKAYKRTLVKTLQSLRKRGIVQGL